MNIMLGIVFITVCGVFMPLSATINYITILKYLRKDGMGTAAGIMIGGGQIGGMVAPALIGYVLTKTGSYSGVFIVSHFWDIVEDGKTYHIGIYGGAGFITLSDEMIAASGKTPEIRDTLVKSIDKVWNEPVDIMLGNHPFHNDTFKKCSRMLAGDKNAFIDPTEWQRFLQELKDTFALYRKMSKEEVKEAFKESGFMEYTGQYIGLKDQK